MVVVVAVAVTVALRCDVNPRYHGFSIKGGGCWVLFKPASFSRSICKRHLLPGTDIQHSSHMDPFGGTAGR